MTTQPDSKKPTGLTLISIFAILLGALGVIQTFIGIFSLGVTPSYFDMLKSVETNHAVDSMYDGMLQAQAAWQPVQIAVLILSFCFGVPLILSGISLLRENPKAIRWIPTFLLCAAVFELVYTAINTYVGMQIFNEFSGTFSGINRHSKIDNMMETTMQITMATTYCITAAWLLVKLTYFIASYRYLKKPDIVARFDLQNP